MGLWMRPNHRSLLILKGQDYRLVSSNRKLREAGMI